MTDKPVFIDNRNGNTLARAIREYVIWLDERLASPPNLDIATSYFNPNGFLSIADELDKVNEVRLLIGAEPKVKDRVRWRKPGEPKGSKYDAKRVEEALRSLDNDLKKDRNLLGFKREIDDNLRRLINFLESEKVEVRRFEEGFLHGKAFIFSDEQGVIAGSSNFTGAGLNSNLELNLAHYNPNVTGQVEDWFIYLWNQSERFDLASIYDKKFEPFSPYIIYLRVLWERYKDELEEEMEEKTGDKIELTTFQNDGVFRAKRFLEQYNGAIVADGVGLGKTYIAGEIIREAVHERRQRALVVAPAYLRDGMWKKFRENLNVHFSILSYSELRNDKQLGGDSQNLQQGKDKYQLVVIDEGHSFRNPSTQQAHALRTLLRGDPPKDLILLTATPVNNSLWDLYYLLNYFIKNDAAFAAEGIPSLRERFKEMQSQDPSNLAPDALFDILDNTTVRRTRKFVKKYYPYDTIKKGEEEVRISFPDINPRRVDYSFHDSIDDEFFSDVEKGLAAGENEEPDLTLARYRPSQYKNDHDGSDLALIGLLRTGILKRFESSKQAFANTITRMINQYQAAFDLLSLGYFPAPEAIDEWIESDSDEAFEEVFGKSYRLKASEFDTDRLKEDLHSDKIILERWLDKAESIEMEEDGKLSELKRTLKNIVRKAKQDSIKEKDFIQNRKVIIFSYFEDTVDWILDYLEAIIESENELQCYKNRIAGVSGSESKRGIARERAVNGFAPDSTDAPPETEDEFDILVTTDVLGQGVNLQQCRNVINYDLPWNPMRVVQRNGRIDRINSSHPQIYVYSFFPEDRLDDLLDLELRIKNKLAQAAKSIGLENQVFPDVETVEQNFADRREEIESLRKEEKEMLERGGETAAAFTGEEYRQELRKGLQEYGDIIESLPWGAGSGFSGKKPGYFFCARIGEEVFLRFVPADKHKVVKDTLTCLKRIECTPETERSLPEKTKVDVYSAWENAKNDIYAQWQRQTDPQNIEPEIRPLFRRVADHIRDYPPKELTQEELEEKIESVEAPWGRRYERELREIYKKDDMDPYEKSEKLADKIDELGLQPFKAPEPLPPIEKDEISLICWIAIHNNGEMIK